MKNDDKVPTDEDLLRSLDERILKAAALVHAQRTRVDLLQQLGSTHALPEIILKNFSKSLELLHWQRALLLWSSADGSLDLRKLQPSPSKRAPDRILECICAELAQHGEGREVSNDDFREIVRKAVDARIRS